MTTASPLREPTHFISMKIASVCLHYRLLIPIPKILHAISPSSIIPCSKTVITLKRLVNCRSWRGPIGIFDHPGGSICKLLLETLRNGFYLKAYSTFCSLISAIISIIWVADSITGNICHISLGVNFLAPQLCSDRQLRYITSDLRAYKKVVNSCFVEQFLINKIIIEELFIAVIH